MCPKSDVFIYFLPHTAAVSSCAGEWDVEMYYDRLYSGPLADEFHLDLPFIPNVGIANTPSPEACKAIVDQLNAEEFEIRGRVETLDVVGFDGERVWPIEQFALPDGDDQEA